MAQAELLARTAAESTGITKLRGFSLERAYLEDPEFYSFDALVGEPGAEGFSGHYAVSKFTGEVWNPYQCFRFSTPHLVRLQRKLRKELGLPAKDSQHHPKSDPCLAGEPPEDGGME